MVNHPPHYTTGKIEVIDFIEDQKLDFHAGQVIKYVARAGKKDPAKELEDLQKAHWYLERKIRNLTYQDSPRLAVHRQGNHHPGDPKPGEVWKSQTKSLHTDVVIDRIERNDLANGGFKVIFHSLGNQTSEEQESIGLFRNPNLWIKSKNADS